MTERSLARAGRAGWPGPGTRTLLGILARFLLVGGMGVAVNSALLALLYGRAHLPLVVASALAIELAIANNFVLNNRWTFGRRDVTLARFARFNLVSLGGLAISTATLWVLVSHLAVYYLAANLVGIALATTWNFALNLLWTWE